MRPLRELIPEKSRALQPVVRINAELFPRIREVAAREDVSVSDFVQIAVRQLLEEYEER